MTSSTVRIGCEIDPIDARTYYSRAYLFAILIFPAQVIKAEADAQHLWYTRRAGTRAKSELIAAIYDKALKRRDYSGIIKKDEEKEKENAKEGEKKKDGKKRDSRKDDPKTGADIGKIVNLMTTDSNKVRIFIF